MKQAPSQFRTILGRIAAAASAVMLSLSASGQALQLRDGRVVANDQMRFDDTGFLVSHPDGGATVRTLYSEVQRMQWPAPPELEQARSLLRAGSAQAAADLMDVVMVRFEPTRNILGSPWQDAAVIRLAALARAGRDIDAAVVMRRLEGATPPPELLAEARLAMGEAAMRRRAFGEARQAIDSVLQSASGDLAARAYLLLGDLSLEQGSFEQALRAYLRIPTFYGRLRSHQPRALLGAARAYRGMGENARAISAYNELIERFRATPEGRLAETELSSLGTRP
jgi:tetratricopeptide (TPR) repeat protein